MQKSPDEIKLLITRLNTQRIETKKKIKALSEFVVKIEKEIQIAEKQLNNQLKLLWAT